MKEQILARPYTALAEIYDVVMAHVGYAAWAEYVHDLLADYAPRTRRVLELGCGTGSLALELQPRGPYEYVATDGSREMLGVARRKARAASAEIRFEEAKFVDFRMEQAFDAIILLYDGLNYLLDTAHVERAFECVFRALDPGGVFIFDQSTPANSLNNGTFFEDVGRHGGFSYVRTSSYDDALRLHTTRFEIVGERRILREEHVQRAYTMEEIRARIDSDRWREVNAFDGFSRAPATETSERIHWLIRKGGIERWS